MNKLEIQGAGFPATNKTWRWLRDMTNAVHELAKLGGVDYILSGCEVQGTTVTDGWVVLDGELLPFKGGSKAVQIAIKETVEKTTYLEDLDSDGTGDSKDTYFERWVEFAAGTKRFDDLPRINPLVELQKARTPVGAIVMWSGAISAIPMGWKLCDGQNGTPDLRGQFIVGYDPADNAYNAIGKQGGQKEVTLTEAQMPQHKHGGSTNSGGSHNHPYRDGYFAENKTSDAYDGAEYLNKKVRGSGADDVDNRYIHYRNRTTNSNGSHSHSLNINNAGGGQAHENRPPYFTLAFIQFKG